MICSDGCRHGFIKAFLRTGVYYLKIVIYAITTPKIHFSNTSDDGYGFGWNIELENEKKILTHGGGMPGYKSYITIIPGDSIDIVILTSKITYFNEELADVVIKCLKGNRINWQHTDADLYGKNFHFSWDEDDTDTAYRSHISIPDFSIYEGEYEDSAYGKALIREEKGKAFLELLPSKNQFSGYLYFLSKDTFKIVFNDQFVPAGEVRFEMNKNGNPKGFRLAINSSDFLFKYLHFKKSK
ncbi:hypothetical protein A8C56_16790 [Niabella ginsenosidivorans]|uniref:Peptidase S12 Pab87-related C-terminal domain-containing protein n=1 Tax=Niabella ginsenosidivorans TaxID=1176587 RepID=A0A1A9I4C4_9BACT|nr:DUF3471 domain-containing protein [Niabella ginsenosidivorans]ANH82403.1 hypothetical protein A8C56_16790 [Niabella ginsenosidivorans]